MTHRCFLLTAAFLLTAICVPARRIPAAEALNRALRSESMSRETNRPHAAQAYDLTYSAPTGSYHVFSRKSGGYIVVSGDDEIYPLLADVGTGAFVLSELAPAARAMLDEYDAQIRAYSASRATSEGLADYYNKWGEIAPLMTTQWNQQYPYNMFCPVIGGRTCVTGCVATAMAQIVRCIGYYNGEGYVSQSGVNYAGEQVEFDYTSATFDFDSMFDFYPASVSIESLNEVGRLMLACGLAVSMNYGTSESGAASRNVPRALVEHFGYDGRYTRLYDRENFSQAQWENMLHGQLEAGRPVYYSGSGAGSHAFVIDGYRPAGLYHVNWGWGGSSDGYFRLTALNPTQTGIGGGTGGYNVGQQMVCAVPPGADPGVVFGKMGGSIRVASDGVYALYYKSNGENMLNVSVGAVIVDSVGNEAATATFWRGQNITANSALRHDAYGYDFSRHPLPSGTYRVYPAFCPEGGEYVIADALYDRPYYVTLTVTDDGKYMVENAGPASYEADIHIAGIVPDYDLHEGFSGSLGFYVVNNGNMDYGGVLRLSLLDSDGDELASNSSLATTVAAGANAVVYCPVPVFDTGGNLIPVGTYPLRFSDGDGKLLSDGEFSLVIKDGAPLSVWYPEDNMQVTNCSSVPAKLLKGELWPHTPLIETTKTNRNMSLRLAFYEPSDVTSAYTLLCYEGTIEPMQALFPLGPIAVEAPFGTYEVCYRKGYNQISQRFPMRIGTSVDGIACYPTSDDGVSAAITEEKRDQVEAVVPAQVCIEGIDRPVTDVEPGAFMMSRELSVIDLPPSIRNIGLNAFTACPSLRQIILRSERPPFALRNYVAPGLSASTEFYVPATAYDDYKPLLEAYNPLYTLIDSIQSREVVVSAPSEEVSLAVYPAHDAINPAFSITPVDEAADSVVEVRAVSVESGMLHLEVRAKREGHASFRIRPAHRSDACAVLAVTVPKLATSIHPPVGAASSSAGRGVYTLGGMRIGTGGKRLRPGFYIVDGHKVVVK